MFHSYVNVYQRVNIIKRNITVNPQWGSSTLLLLIVSPYMVAKVIERMPLLADGSYSQAISALVFNG